MHGVKFLCVSITHACVSCTTSDFLWSEWMHTDGLFLNSASGNLFGRPPVLVLRSICKLACKPPSHAHLQIWQMWTELAKVFKTQLSPYTDVYRSNEIGTAVLGTVVMSI